MKSILNKQFIELDIDLNNKNDIFNYVADKFVEDGVVTNKDQFVEGLLRREAQSPTGFENSIAIPHVQSDGVLEPKIFILRTKNTVADYESLDPNNNVKLIFLIAVPKSSANEHLKILSDLSTKLMNKDLIDKLLKASVNEMIQLLSEDKVKTAQVSKDKSKGLVLGVTACSTGIAHTYMTAEAIEKIAREKGYEVKVEKQGAQGLEDKITQEDVQRAEFIILAHDVELIETNRFNGLNYIDVKVAKPLHDPEKYFNLALNSSLKYVSNSEESSTNENMSVKSEMMQAMMTGISYMIPVIVAGGLLMGIAKLSALFMGGDVLVQSLGSFLPLGSIPVLDGNVDVSGISPDQIASILDPSAFKIFLAYLDKIGWTIMQFMYPIFAMYLSYSIGGKNALLPGFLSGLFAQGLHTRLWGFDQIPSGIMTPFVDSSTMAAVPSGFIGALILAFLVGYLVKYLNKIKFHKNLVSLKNMLIIPGVSVLVAVIVSMFFIEPVFGAFNIWLQQLITENASSQYLYASSIAAATAFDLGGPVNKAAGAVAMGLAADGTIAMTARTLSIVIPPLGLGLCTIISSIFKLNIFSEDEKTTGSTSFLLGFLAISEGAIPFMIKNPLIVIPINVIGAVLGSVVAIFLGAEMWLPLPAIWGWPLVEGSVIGYLIGLLVGVSFIVIANILVRKMKFGKK